MAQQAMVRRNPPTGGARPTYLPVPVAVPATARGAPAIVVQQPALPARRGAGQFVRTAAESIKEGAARAKKAAAGVVDNAKENAAPVGTAAGAALVTGLISVVAVAMGAKPRNVLLVTGITSVALAAGAKPGSTPQKIGEGGLCATAALTGATAYGAVMRKREEDRAKQAGQVVAPQAQPAPAAPPRQGRMPEDLRAAIEEARLRDDANGYSEYAGWGPDDDY